MHLDIYPLSFEPLKGYPAVCYASQVCACRVILAMKNSLRLPFALYHRELWQAVFALFEFNICSVFTTMHKMGAAMRVETLATLWLELHPESSLVELHGVVIGCVRPPLPVSSPSPPSPGTALSMTAASWSGGMVTGPPEPMARKVLGCDACAASTGVGALEIVLRSIVGCVDSFLVTFDGLFQVPDLCQVLLGILLEVVYLELPIVPAVDRVITIRL